MTMNEDIPFQFFLAKLFGEPLTETSEDGVLTGYAWRGQLFITSFTPALVPPPLPRTFE